VIDQLVLALFLECNDDQSDKYVDEEKWEDNEVDDIEDGHLNAEARLWSTILVRSIN